MRMKTEDGLCVARSDDNLHVFFLSFTHFSNSQSVTLLPFCLSFASLTFSSYTHIIAGIFEIVNTHLSTTLSTVIPCLYANTLIWMRLPHA